jgi:hypothetical protein
MTIPVISFVCSLFAGVVVCLQAVAVVLSACYWVLVMLWWWSLVVSGCLPGSAILT